MYAAYRKSNTHLNRIYFWTATIHKWLPLLETEKNKLLLIAYLKQLSDKRVITIFAFVIMPNHIHLVWQQNEMNGRETPKGSFLKFSAHEFLKELKATGNNHLYVVNAANKRHEIWQRDSLGIEIYNRAVAKQKLDYIHFNPVRGKWLLAKSDLDYYYSSARFYETGVDDFGFLNNLYDVFDGDGFGS